MIAYIQKLKGMRLFCNKIVTHIVLHEVVLQRPDVRYWKNRKLLLEPSNYGKSKAATGSVV